MKDTEKTVRAGELYIDTEKRTKRHGVLESLCTIEDGIISTTTTHKISDLLYSRTTGPMMKSTVTWQTAFIRFYFPIKILNDY